MKHANEHQGTQPVETPRLVLRRFVPDDAEAMYQGWATDPEVSRWLRWTPHKDIEETRDIIDTWIRGYQDPEQYLWAIQRKEDGALLGSLGILRGNDGISPDVFEPAYCIARAFWGRGYTTEALQGAMEYFVRITGATQLRCCHAVGNPASGRVMQKAGFVYTHDGEYHTFDGTAVPAKYYVWNIGKESS